MAYFIELPTFCDDRGKLAVIQDILPFDVKRFYFIYDVMGTRGGHRHKKNKQALLCLGGRCDVHVNNGAIRQTFILDVRDKCLILEPDDWHIIDNFSRGTVLFACASEYYDPNDYVLEEYK